MSAAAALTDLGFQEGQTDEWQKLSDNLGLSENYPHKVLAVYTKGDITALVEQNVSEDNGGGVSVIMKHPPVLILESPRGRVCVSNHDDPANAALIESVVEDLS